MRCGGASISQRLRLMWRREEQLPQRVAMFFIVTPSTATPWRDASSASRWGRYRRAQRRSSSATTLCSHAFCRGDKAPLHLPRGNVICTVPAERRTVACSTSAKRKLRCRSSVLTQNRGVITILNPAMAYSAWIDLDFVLSEKRMPCKKQDIQLTTYY